MPWQTPLRLTASISIGAALAMHAAGGTTEPGSTMLCSVSATEPEDGTAAAALHPAVALARNLSVPPPRSQQGGEYEDGEWWDTHEAQLGAARAAWGAKHSALYAFDADFEERYIEPGWRAAVAAAYGAAERGDGVGLRAAEGAIQMDLAQPAATARGVRTLTLFTPAFCADLLGELDHWEASGIPLRRPNGMNRYGAALDALGMGAALHGLVEAYVRPVAQLLFPSSATDADFAEHHGFVVRYKEGGDVSLAEHADASTITLNVGLGRGNFTGGAVHFGRVRRFGSGGGGYDGDVDDDVEGGDVAFEGSRPGDAVLHRGQHLHAATALTSGERVNLVLWTFGSEGVVRVVPYKSHEQSTPETRWARRQSTQESPWNLP